jgi:hypothetical protein
MSKDFFSSLKEYFEGKTVVSVDPPEAPEAIAKFTMSDGKAFRLHATDLGYWIEETIPSDGSHLGFDSLFNDYGHHYYNLQPQYGFDTPYPSITVDGRVLQVVAADGRVFKGDTNKFSLWEQFVCKHPDGLKLLVFASEMGDMWKTVFCRRQWDDEVESDYFVPKELRLPWTGD